MQTYRNQRYRIYLTLVVLLVFSRISFAGNSIVLLVEQALTEELPQTIATSQSALDNFIHKNGEDAEIALVSYATTADVIQPFIPFSKDSANALTSNLKAYGPRGESTNAASGVERAIALLNSEAATGNSKFLLVVSDATISTGDKELDTQFTEWLTEIISEDAVNSGIDVSWYPISSAANHKIIDNFLAKLNGRRVVLSPEPGLIEEVAVPPASSEAEQQLALISESLATVKPELVNNAPEMNETPATESQEELELDGVTKLDAAPINDESVATKQDEPFQLNIARPETDSESEALTNNTPHESTIARLFTPENIKLAVLIVIALTAIFLLKTLLVKRRESEFHGTSLADKEYRDSSDAAIKTTTRVASSVATKINAPTPSPPNDATSNAPSKNFSILEPVPKPLVQTDVRAEIDVLCHGDDEPMDATQDAFPEFSSASLIAASIDEPKTKLNPREAEAELPPTDPYATVIADADQLKEYAKQFSEGNVGHKTDKSMDDSGDVETDKTVLHQPVKT